MTKQSPARPKGSPARPKGSPARPKGSPAQTTSRARAAAPARRLNLALQGGGAHGAFTWGVLDRLLDEEDIAVEGVTATSAGAMNGAMLTTGMKSGGRSEAKERLAAFWKATSDAHPLNQPPFSFWTGVLGAQPLQAINAGLMSNGMINSSLISTGYLFGDLMSRIVSPYDFNPANVNPLRDLLENIVDFDAVCRTDDPRLFVCATDVQAGRARIFKGEEITVDALLASACLPTMFQAVEIEGRFYWDGGFTGNPALFPLIYECVTEDILIVHINPIERSEAPRGAAAIQDRINEISFNSNLLGELRAIETVRGMVERGELAPGSRKSMRIHAVSDFAAVRRLSLATKLAPDWRMLQQLRDAGQEAMDDWLAENKQHIGVQGSVDISSQYL